MADRKKFEEMLERLINEDREGAEALFHELVVEKSRDIYESLLEDDLDIEEASEEEDDEEEVDEASEEDDEEDEEVSEDFNLDEFEVEADPMDAMGGDPTDDMLGDIEMGADDEGEEGEEGEEDGDVEDRIDDLEDAFEELKAEFDKLMADEAGEEEHGDMNFGSDEEGDEDEEEEGDEEKEAFNFGEADEEDDEEEVSEAKSAAEQMREYVEKVAPAKMGDNGANTKSAVAGKNDMGGTTSNIVRNDTEAGVEANKGHLKGSSLFKGSEKEDNAGNVNVPGGKASKSLKAQPKGHGAEKKGAGETAVNKKPVVGG